MVRIIPPKTPRVTNLRFSFIQKCPGDGFIRMETLTTLKSTPYFSLQLVIQFTYWGSKLSYRHVIPFPLFDIDRN